MPPLIASVLAPGTLAGTLQPTLDGYGLLLRPWRDSDARAVVDAYRDPEVQRWVRHRVDPVEAPAWIADWHARWVNEAGAGWAVVDAEVVVGFVGLPRINLHEGAAELAYWTCAPARGRGIAYRAGMILVDWAERVMSFHRVELSHAVANTRSCTVAQRLGFDLEGVRRRQGRHADGWHDMHWHARVAG
jgi:RimJ/RimL family protein N-acetyltransferase